ncbi:12633_t:CDS:2 [Acaulospora morrowiae]|uniref:12633_t:CDS:1 n=1 Tax=Acaulospora morrowiae TaxID=94023 RepID=A0A9N9EZK4_9GLOM|nr:12633_t:CDS:2 [Acaulospora morrowiae]
MQRYIKKSKNDEQVDPAIEKDRGEIFYDPTKSSPFERGEHKTQIETRKSTKEETIDYIQSQWVSEDFDAEDLRSVNLSQPFIMISPESTFIEKFLEKRCQRRFAKHQVPIDNNNSSIPAEYLELLEVEIFCKTNVSDSISRDLWNEFGRWAYFTRVPNFRKKFRHHCRRLWAKIRHAHEQRIKTWKGPLEDHEIPEVFQRHPKDKLVIADETTKKIINNIHLDSYQYISKSHCIKNTFGETMVDFFDLDNSESVRVAQSAVDDYYEHTRKHVSHQSSQFINNLAEQFGCLTDSNIEPYVTASTVSNHSQDHRSCVNKLMQGLQLLSDAVNDYFGVSYPALYAKMKKLNLGSNVPKCFGAFPTVGINFNSICQFHRDLKDHPNTLCVVCPLGTFEGGHLAFPELKLAIMAKQGQAIAFRSHLLIHGNLPLITGSRHSIIFYIHSTVVKQKRKFGSLFDEDALEILDTTHSITDGVKKYPPP